MSSDNDHISPQSAKAIEALKVELEMLLERSVLLALAHKYAARRWSSIHLWLGIPSTVLAGVSGVSALSRFDTSQIITGILSILAASLTALNTFLDPSKRSNNHLSSSSKYEQLRLQIKNSVIFLQSENGIVTDLVSGIPSPQSLLEKFEFISNELQKISSESPILPEWSIRRAKRALRNEHNGDSLLTNLKSYKSFLDVSLNSAPLDSMRNLSTEQKAHLDRLMEATKEQQPRGKTGTEEET